MGPDRPQGKRPTWRATAILSTLAALVAVAAIVSLGLRPSSGDEQLVDVVAAATSSPSPTTVVPDDTTTPAPPTTSKAPEPLVTVAPPITTSAPPPVTSSVAPPTTSPLEYDWCTWADFSLDIALERDTYRQGDLVRGSARYVHTSDQPCLYSSTNQRTSWLYAATGEPVGGPVPTVHGDCFRPCGPPSQPGEVTEAPLCWDQRDPSTGELVPPGIYQVEVLMSYGGTVTATADFEIVDLPPTSTTFPAPSC